MRAPDCSLRHHAIGAPDIDAGEEEQPDHVDEMPVPGGGFEAEMTGRGELARDGAAQADGQEDACR